MCNRAGVSECSSSMGGCRKTAGRCTLLGSVRMVIIHTSQGFKALRRFASLCVSTERVAQTLFFLPSNTAAPPFPAGACSTILNHAIHNPWATCPTLGIAVPSLPTLMINQTAKESAIGIARRSRCEPFSYPSLQSYPSSMQTIALSCEDDMSPPPEE